MSINWTDVQVETDKSSTDGLTVKPLADQSYDIEVPSKLPCH